MTVVPTMSSEDNLSQLQELVSKGEKRGVFNDNIPSTIQRSVRERGREEGSRVSSICQWKVAPKFNKTPCTMYGTGYLSTSEFIILSDAFCLDSDHN